MDNKIRTEFCSLLTALSVLIIFGAIGTAEGHKELNDIKNKAFTDPSVRTEMPEEWIKKAVKYEKEAEGSDLTIVLDQDIYHTFISLIQEYGKKNNIKIAVKEGTCGIAAGSIGKKTIDIGGFCCPAGKEDRLPGIRFHTLGIVAKAILVHPDNPVDALSIEQARDVFRGRIVRWSELKTGKGQPGPGTVIRPIARFHCKARPGHWYHLLPDEKMFSPLAQEVGSIPDMITQVASDKTAVGWEVLSMVEYYKETKKVRPVKINGHEPTDKKSLITGDYPLYRVYNLTTWEGENVVNPHAAKLISYLMKEAENLDSKFGFVPSSKLRKAGWRFSEDELAGEPLRPAAK